MNNIVVLVRVMCEAQFPVGGRKTPGIRFSYKEVHEEVVFLLSK